MNLTAELAMLYNQQLAQYDELKDLREKVRAAEQRYTRISQEIGEELAKQILPSAVKVPLADSAPPTPLAHREMGGGFTLKALTPRGADHIDEVQRLLCGLTRGDA